MRIALFVLLPLLSSLSFPVRAAEPREIVLANDRFEIGDTTQWRFEVLRESSGRFADVKIKPRSGDDFSLTLYFLADTADMARLDSPAKIAASVSAGAERYLPQIVEKKITLQKVSPRGSYGSITVLTAAGLQGAPGEFRYQTRGMIRLSPDAALGFSLLSNEINSAAYRQLLNYVYSFVRLTPNATASPAAASVPAPAPAAKPLPVPVSTPDRTAAPASGPDTKPAPAPTPTPIAAPRATPQISPVPERVAPPTPAAAPPQPARRGTQRDLRDCVSLPTNAEIMRCVSERK